MVPRVIVMEPTLISFYATILLNKRPTCENIGVFWLFFQQIII